ncbi:N-formylglutamate deformylase [Thalassotalea sediminis]|uniref:N-formylglutamate deformylase n=1 Tax=Thalassotalea sediminis TaxID=1759089 RepID=UPI00257419D7|nr:N-formylglutamate deformylase [Thalassotalea sediminis]
MTYQLHQGTVPLLISMPHNGSEVAEEIALNMTDKGLSSQDTDWYKDRLYHFAKALGAYIIMPKYSRYVIDLNRDPNGVDLYPGANSTELCPTTAFDMTPLYLEGKAPDHNEVARRITQYWLPYHQALETTLNDIKAKFGCAVLLEAHSIKSVVPRFFDGQLPDFNFGTSEGRSCDPALLAMIEKLNFAPYSSISNGRFKGGYITRHYGSPSDNIHAVQLELSQRTYMEEESLEYCHNKAQQVIPKLNQLVCCLIEFARSRGK